MKALIITYNDSYDYNTRTKYVERFLKEKGYEVEHLISNFDHRRKTQYKAVRDNITLIDVPPYKRNISFGRLLSCYVFAKKIKEYVLHNDFDLIYHCAPPNSTIKELSMVKKEKEFFLITEIGDMWPESFPVSAPIKKILTIPFNKWAHLRDHYLENTDCVVAECDLFREYLCKKSSINAIKTIYFCQEWKADRINPVLAESELVLCYLGSINNIIDIDMISNVIGRLSITKTVIVHIIGDGEKRDSLIQSLQLAGAKVCFHGMVFDDEIKRKIFSECHYGINVMKNDVFVGMTMKSLDYFAYGMPMINNIRGDIWHVVEKEKIGFNINYTNVLDVCKVINELNNEQYQLLRDNVKVVHSKLFSLEAFTKTMNEVLEL